MIDKHRSKEDQINEMIRLRLQNQELRSSFNQYCHADLLIIQLKNKIYITKQQFLALLNLLLGVSARTDLSYQEIQHNHVAARLYHIDDWENASHSDKKPPSFEILLNDKDMSLEEVPIQRNKNVYFPEKEGYENIIQCGEIG